MFIVSDFPDAKIYVHLGTQFSIDLPLQISWNRILGTRLGRLHLYNDIKDTLRVILWNEKTKYGRLCRMKGLTELDLSGKQA